MLREFFISLYLCFYRVLFTTFKAFPLKNKIVFVASFADNNLYIYRELQKKQFPGEVVFLCKKNCVNQVNRSVNDPVYRIEAGKLFDEIKAAYHLMTAKTVIVDNYYGFLAVANFKQDVECIQIWHAVGAVKNFGYLDPMVATRSKRAQQRFSDVYRRFHKIVVGSDVFAEIFMKAFGTNEDQFLRFGYPRTDFFFQMDLHEERKAKFFKKYSMYRNKKIILYAPTFRPNMEDNQLVLNIEEMYKQLKDEYVLFIRMHPSVQLPTDHLLYEDFVVDFSKGASINDLLLVSDYLITDYSSIPFEYVLLNKPMIFYPYDLEKYEKNPGLWDRYEHIVPGPVAYKTEEIISKIKLNDFPYNAYDRFKLEWNEYNKGKASQNIVNYLLERHHIEGTFIEGRG